MKDRRSVDDLSIDELQRALAEKKRAAREARLAKYRALGRALPTVPVGVTPDARLEDGARPRAPRSLARRLFDFFLLIIEVGAVIGLVYVLYNGSNILSQLNQEVAQVISESVPTLAPTPLITAVVLPSGHTPPDPASGSSQPNESEIPESLRPLVQALPPPLIPTPGPSQALRLNISAIGVNAPVVQGDGWEQLKKGVAQHLGTPDPGQPGNVVLSAHNDIFGEIFRRLDELQAGDEVQLETASQVFTYVITGWELVEPTDVHVMAPTAHPSLTLISCYPYLVDTQRIVVFADLKSQ
ncbi:MAG: sortase [Anaerolineales bacterium]